MVIARAGVDWHGRTARSTVVRAYASRPPPRISPAASHSHSRYIQLKLKHRAESSLGMLGLVAAASVALPAPAVLVVEPVQVAQLAPAAWLRRRTWVKATVAWAAVRATLVFPMVMGRPPVAVQVGVPR